MFELHPRIAADTLAAAEWRLCRVLLMNDANYPWLLLVPRRTDTAEITDLDEADRRTLMDEIGRASAALRAVFAPHRINVAALGNVVPQLHVHVIARETNDAAWPRPVWGAVPARPYSEAEAAERLERLRPFL